MVSLRPYQEEAIEAINNEWTQRDKTLLVLPTGCGKTVVFNSIASERARMGSKVLILAHREELLDQARQKLLRDYGVDSALEKAESTSIGSAAPVVVGSIQTMASEKRLERFAPDDFGTVIVDEAHHSLASTYQTVLGHFRKAKVLGVTATPDRADMRNLGQYYESLAYEYTLRDAVREGYLSPIRAMTMPLEIDLSGVKTKMGDFQEASLANALEPYLDSIADQMVDICKGRHTVVFLPLVSMAQEFRDLLNRKGLRAAEVNGSTINRKEVIADFENGKYDVICNAMLLTEGWDCPIVDTIVMLRPTKSRALYCQAVGRGTRLYPGKEALLLLDFLWLTGKHRLMRPTCLICKTDEVADRAQQLIDEGGEVDITEAESQAIMDVKEARQLALAKEIAANRAKKKKLVDPLEFEIFQTDGLADYQPTFGWECEPPSDKQLQMLEGAGLDTREIKTRGYASQLIGVVQQRREKGLCTPKQARCLEQRGFVNVYNWKFSEASAMISRLAAVGWKIWRIGISPATYVPESLKERYGS